jgi:hypothetical protein
VAETSYREKESVVHGEAVAIWSDSRKAISVLVAEVVFANDLKKVSVDCDESVEKRNDCLRESGDAHEICHDALLDRDFDHRCRRGHIYLARAEVAVTCVSWINQHVLFLGVMHKRTVEIASPVVVLHDQNLYPFLLDHLLCDRRHGNDLHVHGQGGRSAQGAQGVQDDPGARCGGMNRSCRFAPDLRDGAARPRLWTSGGAISYVNYCRNSQPSHLFLLEFELLCLQQLTRYTHRTILRTQHEVPKLFTERGCVLVQEASKLDLYLLDFGLPYISSNVRTISKRCLTNWFCSIRL